jgi:hypothetical protein
MNFIAVRVFGGAVDFNMKTEQTVSARMYKKLVTAVIS